MSIQHIQSSLREAHTALENLLSNQAALATIEQASGILIDTFERKGRVYSCGNGGSMCDAMHFAEELTGRYRKDRAALGAAAISDPGHMSCVGNVTTWVMNRCFHATLKRMVDQVTACWRLAPAVQARML